METPQQEYAHLAQQAYQQPLTPHLIEERWTGWFTFAQACRMCQHELAPHWQLCASCDIRALTACPQCAHPLPPLGARACCCGLPLPDRAVY